MSKTTIRVFTEKAKKIKQEKNRKPARSVRIDADTIKSKLTEKAAKLSGSKVFKPFKRLGDYFAGSFREIRQVVWPNRKASRNLTIAVILFSAVFVVIIILLDFGFEKLFELIIKKG